MKYDALKIENQLCFPLYAASKEIVKRYKPYLDQIGLTYTQYIVMMVFWEFHGMNIKKLGEHLFLDSGTLTPVVKKLESMGYLTRKRMPDDERNLMVELTKEGDRLKEEAIKIPFQMAQEFSLTEEESTVLYQTLYKILASSKEE